MPGSVPSMAVQKKQSVIPPSQGPLSTRTIKSQRVGNRLERTGENGPYSKPNSQTKKTASCVNTSVQICNTVSPRTVAASNGLNVDERLKAARERREEQQKLLASRELSRLEREQRARLYYEQQLQERKKKLQEQRLKEEKRRTAVEEKRKLRLREEKERNESAVRRTLEKSQKAQQHLDQNLRGRKATKNVSYHSMITSAHKPQHHSGQDHHRLPSASPSSNRGEQKSIGLPKSKAVSQKDHFKKSSNTGSESRSSALAACVKPTTGTQKRKASPSPDRSTRRSVSRHSATLQLDLPSVPEEDGVVCGPALSPGNKRPVRRSAKDQQEKLKKENPQESSCSNLSENSPQRTVSIRTAGDGSPSKMLPRTAPQAPEVPFRASAGTSDPEEASRLLAEKRREARLQREKQEQERLQQEEAERRSREELERRRADERARQEAEARRLIEEKRRREEEEQRRAEEERAQARREAALLQKQREEELAKEMARAEQMKQEREIVAQKEDAERQARKKRLEEIMRRTRRTDSPDTTSVPVRNLANEAQPKENTEPSNNGTVAVGPKTTQLGLNCDEDMVPVVAFKERRSHRALSGLEEIQSHQRAEVI
ncbi:uncharacterized protein map7a isoform 3-T3 [Menidia menidia]